MEKTQAETKIANDDKHMQESKFKWSDKLVNDKGFEKGFICKTKGPDFA